MTSGPTVPLSTGSSTVLPSGTVSRAVLGLVASVITVLLFLSVPSRVQSSTVAVHDSTYPQVGRRVIPVASPRTRRPFGQDPLQRASMHAQAPRSLAHVAAALLQNPL